MAYYNLGNSYDVGSGVNVDKKKAKYYYELAAVNGGMQARYNLGCLEGNAGNHLRSIMMTRCRQYLTNLCGVVCDVVREYGSSVSSSSSRG